MSIEVPRYGLHGSINHVSITVSDLPSAMKFFRPLLEFLGYTVGEVFRSRSGADLTLNLNMGNGTAINIWQAKPELATKPFEIYAPGLHHLAFNVEKHEHIDAVHALAKKLSAEILDGPGEFPFGPGGYYAVYFLGPDRIKIEVVHMPMAEARYAEMTRAIERGSKS
ncbi:MAG TPA: VOC family protein [Candidatus Binataceae bacterium]|nr:VOC family protein [Candidatus Binataceae bacterium]